MSFLSLLINLMHPCLIKVLKSYCPQTFEWYIHTCWSNKMNQSWKVPVGSDWGISCQLFAQLSESCVKTPKLVEQSHPAIYITDLSSNNVHSCIHTSSCIIYNQDSYSRSYIQYSSFMAINWFPLLNTVYVFRSVPKFMKRMKGPDYKDKTVFGVPLIVHVQRYGHPLPISLQLALRFLRSQCLDQVHRLVHICKTDYKVHSKLGQSQSLFQTH